MASATAFSRASRPGVPNSFWIGAPSSRLTGRATVVERLATPRKIASAPPPARAIKPIVPPGLSEQPDQEQHGADDGDDDAGDEAPAGAERGEADLGPHRRDRRDLRRPPGGHEHRQQRDADADDDRHDDRARLELERGVGEAGAGGVEQGDDALGDAEPAETMPSTVAVTEMISASSHDQAPNLLRAGSDARAAAPARAGAG